MYFRNTKKSCKILLFYPIRVLTAYCLAVTVLEKSFVASMSVICMLSNHRCSSFPERNVRPKYLLRYYILIGWDEGILRNPQIKPGNSLVLSEDSQKLPDFILSDKLDMFTFCVSDVDIYYVRICAPWLTHTFPTSR